jgi:hypothetical protein
MNEAKAAWAATPAPVRGEVVRRIGNKIRERQVRPSPLLPPPNDERLPVCRCG